jgi:hypothetical protein
MTIGRRYELLMAVASRNIPESRRKWLLESASLSIDTAVVGLSKEEYFWLFGSMMILAMKPYSDHVGEIVKEMYGDLEVEEPHG